VGATFASSDAFIFYPVSIS